MAEEQTIGELVASASRDLSALVRDELELAKLEMRDDMKSAAVGGGMFGAAGLLGALAVLMLSFAAAYGLVALGLAPGWAFLIVGGAYIIVAGILGLVGKASVSKLGPPERTVRTAKETVAYLKNPKPRSTV